VLVESLKDLQVIVDHFDKYSLISAKVVDYILFKKAFNIIQLQGHLTQEGLLKLIGIKASLNLGLTPSLKEAFPFWEKVQFNRPEFIFKGIPDPNWIAGFSSGDGSFNIKISSSTTSKLGSRVQLRFSIGLNIREKELIESFITYFDLGYSSTHKAPENSKYVYFGNNSVSFEVVKHSDIIDIIIPFLKNTPYKGKKA
jgi:hypothetical protein